MARALGGGCGRGRRRASTRGSTHAVHRGAFRPHGDAVTFLFTCLCPIVEYPRRHPHIARRAGTENTLKTIIALALTLLAGTASAQDYARPGAYVGFSGVGAIEKIAREELGMVKADEIVYQADP